MKMKTTPCHDYIFKSLKLANKGALECWKNNFETIKTLETATMNMSLDELKNLFKFYEEASGFCPDATTIDDFDSVLEWFNEEGNDYHPTTENLELLIEIFKTGWVGEWKAAFDILIAWKEGVRDFEIFFAEFRKSEQCNHFLDWFIATV